MNNKQKQYKNEWEKANYDKVLLRLKKPYKDIIKDRAKDLEKSVNEYIVDLIMEDLEKRD